MLRHREYEWIPREAARAGAASLTARSASISACLIVRNAEDCIERCLESLAPVVNEILVVHDGPCADHTLEIASGFGARIIEAPFYGHCERHTPLAYAEARGEWLLNLDADEFLSPPLQDALRELVRAPDVNGYRFRWRHWDGARHVSRDGPYKLVLFRRSATRMVGVIHMAEEVDGAVRSVPLDLEHRPPDGHRGLGAMYVKWRARAPLQAREYLTALETVPRFNYPGTIRWTSRRELTNTLSPLLIAPAALHTFFFVLSDLWRELGPREALRFASTEAAYRAMVTAYVAWLRYGRRAR